MTTKPKCAFCNGRGKTTLYSQDYVLDRPCGFCGGSGEDESGKLARVFEDIQTQGKREEKESRVDK